MRERGGGKGEMFRRIRIVVDVDDGIEMGRERQKRSETNRNEKGRWVN